VRILIATDTFPVVSQTFITLHCASLIARGHEVAVLARPGGDLEKCATHAPGIDLGKLTISLPRLASSRLGRLTQSLARLPKTPRSLLLCRAALSDAARGRLPGHALTPFSQAALLDKLPRFDIVHAHFGMTAIQIAQLAEGDLLRSPFISTFHGSDLNLRGGLSTRERYDRVFRQATFLTVGSRHMAEHLVEAGIPEDRFEIVPMGIDLDRFVPLPNPPERIAEPRLATVGRLVEFKGIEYAIRTIARLQTDWPGITLDVLGDGPLRDQLVELSKELGVAEAVRFHGALPHVRIVDVLKQANIYIHPGIVASDGTREGQGVALAEAQALKLPIVTTRAGGIPESVAEGDSAFVVEPKDVDALARHVDLLIRDPQLRHRMGAAGRAFVEQHLDQRVLTDRWIALYERLVAAYHPA
jgi:colanic acid/amylovoran biosynthesis glycosyltransferase